MSEQKVKNQLMNQIRVLAKKIRDTTPLNEHVLWQKPASLFTRDDYLNGQRVRAASITLLPTGCEYAKSGGCTMCGEWSGSNLGELVHGEFHVAQFASACANLFHSEDIAWLRIYQEGSFLNSREVDPDARDIILQLASSLRNVKRVTIESRAEYLTNVLAKKIRNNVQSPVELEIGIGLEAHDEFIRNVCVGKGTTLKSYEQAVRIAHSNDIIALAYVLLKPPFLSEKQAIDEAVRSIAYAFEIGFDEVYVQAASIHEWSLAELLWKQGAYTLPWLWSMLDVVRQTSNLGKVKIGGLEYFPIPSTISQNYLDSNGNEPCSCSQNVWHSIQEYNATHNVNSFSEISCSCQEIWKDLIHSDSQQIPMTPKIQGILSAISLDDYLKSKQHPTT